MRRAVVVKLDPSPSQERQLLSHLGAARFCYNTVLAYVNEAYRRGERVNLSGYSLRKLWNANKDIWAPWWNENSKEAYSNALINLGTAWKRYFAGVAGRPRMKRRGTRDSYTITTGAFGICDSHGVKVPRIGRIHTFESLSRYGDVPVTSMTIRRRADGFYVSLAVDVPDPQPVPATTTVGVDVGILHLATLSTGEKITNPKALRRLQRKRARVAREVSRRRKGSANREKAKAKLSRIDRRITCIRQDATHKATTAIARRYAVVAVEDLKVSSMMKNHRLAGAIADANFFEFRRQLDYKTKQWGHTFVVVDTWFPSTKRCSRCGNVQPVALSQRTYVCSSCGFICDRDVNAARNLCLVAGSAPETLNACGETVRLSLDAISVSLGTLVSLKQEPCCSATTSDAEPRLVTDGSRLCSVRPTI